MTHFKISVVIVTYNSENDIRECLDSLKDQTFKDFNIVVVDNASKDDTAKIVKDNYADFVHLLELSENRFLTGGNNYGMKFCIENFESEFVLVLNPDVKCESNLIESLLVPMSDPIVGATGPKVKFYRNQNEGLINSAGLLFDGFNQAYDIGFMEKDEGQFDEEKTVFGVTGTAILFRSSMLKEIGFYWEKIKLYLDEVEMFIRMQKTGWKVIYTPKTTIHHKYMQSTDKMKLGRVEKVKKEAWLWIAMRHYSLRAKLAMIKLYLFK
ncbi:MAG: glycosyltransferase family 2 protein [Candidatus Dojkabacteria bacterium]